MNWKILLSLFIIFAVLGLLIFSPKGKEFKQKYLDAYITKTADVIKSAPEKITTKEIDSNEKFNVLVTTEPISLEGFRFNIEDDIEVELIYDSIELNGNFISSKNTEKIIFRAEKIKGTVFFEDRKMKITGISNMVEVNDIVVLSDKDSTIEFEVVGVPVSYTLNKVTKNSMKFSNIFGLIQLGTWSPLSLNDDDLEIEYFDGYLKMQEDNVLIDGSVYKVKLNNVDLSLEKK